MAKNIYDAQEPENAGGNPAVKIIIIITLIVILALISLASAFYLFYKPQTPTELPFSTETNESVYPVQNEHTPPEDAAPAPQNGDGSYTAKPNVYNFLVLGHDRVSNSSDVMMLVNFNVETGKVSIMQIPRDTYVENDTNSHKINAAYLAYYNRAIISGTANPEMNALDQVATMLEKTLCINISYQAVMDLDGFVSIVDILGGVDVDIPADMFYEDPEQDLYINLKAGYQHLDGAQSEQFIRYREGWMQADIGRINAQKIFMTALINQVKTNLSVDVISKLASEIMNNIYTTISLKDLVYFAKKVLSVDLGAITMMTLPGIDAYVNGVSYYVMNRPETLGIINTYFNIYNTEISDAIFDKNFSYTDENDAEVYSKYLGKSSFTIIDEFTADEILGDSINIPKK